MLNENYIVFGEIVGGMEILDAISESGKTHCFQVNNHSIVLHSRCSKIYRWLWRR